LVKVNNRKVLDGVLDALGLEGETNAAKRLTVMRAIDKLERLGKEGVRHLLGEGRKDESGDFTKGAGLSDKDVNLILDFVAPVTPTENIPATPSSDSDIMIIMPRSWDALAGNANFREGGRELLAIKKLLENAGYGQDRILIDQTVVRGLEYYTGPVFEVELTFPAKDGTRFGSVGGGGRYDGLVSRFRGEPVPATGFSIGVSRLAAALQHLGKLDSKEEPGPVVVTVFDQDRLADYQAMVARLRAANIRAELYLGSGKFGAQMKYADKRNSPCVVIQGSDEKAKGEVMVKDLVIGAELAKLEKGREEHLQKQAEAQVAVTEDRLVEVVREVLARHRPPNN
jgi:histidyl-tRNA synthetase